MTHNTPLSGPDNRDLHDQRIHYDIFPPLEQRRPVCSGSQAILPGRVMVNDGLMLLHGHCYLFWLHQVHPLMFDTDKFHCADPVGRHLQRLENRLMNEHIQVILSRT